VADNIFDGERILTGCSVLIHGEWIVDVVIARRDSSEAPIVDLGAGSVLAPGLHRCSGQWGGGVY